MTTVTKVSKDSHAENKGKNDLGLLIRRMLWPPLVTMHHV